MYHNAPDSLGTSQLTQSEAPEYVTSDLNQAAFLACRGLDPSRAQPPLPSTYPRFASFVFSRTSALERALAEWDGEQAMVEVHEYVDHRWDMYQWARSVVRGGAR
jgi:hypothetical protein